MQEESKILIIEDEEGICDILSYSLRREGFDVRWALSGKEGLELMEEVEADIVILDLMLPDISGFEICKTLMVKYNIPIIMLTARNDIVDKVIGLEIGADDYITKPFDIREVIARVKVSLRRKRKLQDVINNQDKNISNRINVNENIYINYESRKVYKNGEIIRLKPREYDLLFELAENRDRVLSREQLLDLIWEMDYEGDVRTVDVHVQRLRKKLDHGSESIIETVFGVGYKLR